jgi:hypothetical protein
VYNASSLLRFALLCVSCCESISCRILGLNPFQGRLLNHGGTAYTTTDIPVPTLTAHMTPLVLYLITSILSVAGSSSVILTLLLFKSMRSKLFMQIIAYISLADIIANVEYTMSYRPANHNWWCSTEGFLNLYGYPCGWLWTTMLMKFLHDLAVHKEVKLSMRSAFIICWGVPLVTTLLYLAFIPSGTYERPSGGNTQQLCSYGGNDFEQGFVWHMVSYYGLFVACVGYMVYTYLQLRKVYHVKEQRVTEDPERPTEGGESPRAALRRVRLTSESLLLYPLIMVVLWAPHMVGVALSLELGSNAVTIYAFMATNLKILCGLATAVLFFWKSQAARTLWIRLLCNRRTPNNGSNGAEEDAEFARSTIGSSFRDSSFAEYSLYETEDSFMTAQYGPRSTAAFGGPVGAHSVSASPSMSPSRSLFGYGRSVSAVNSVPSSGHISGVTQNPLGSGAAITLSEVEL